MTTTKAWQIQEFDEDPSHSNERHHVSCREYRVTKDKESKNIISVQETTQHSTRHLLNAPFKVAKELFLPIGYPHTTSEGYLDYQLYDSLQGLCSYLRGVVCSAQVLQAAGVGNSEATALSAALTWALKDGLAMVGGLLFSYTAAPLFDSYVKEFRLFADLINDVGLSLDMVAPYFSHHLLWVTSAATLCKTLCGISAGATKSSITQHFALEGNMADLNAKESTQETLVSLIGMLLGVALAHQLSRLEQEWQQPDLAMQIQWVIFAILTLLHVWANWKGVRLLRLRTLNRERAGIVLSGLLDILLVMMHSKELEPGGFQKILSSHMEELPQPTDVHESLLSSTIKMIWPGRLRLGARLTKVLIEDAQVVDEFSSERYVLTFNGRGHVLVCLLTGADTNDELQAFLHALLILRCSQSKANVLQDLSARRKLVTQTLEQVKMLFDSSNDSNGLLTALEKRGWDVHGRLYLGFPRRRSRWSSTKAE